MTLELTRTTQQLLKIQSATFYFVTKSFTHLKRYGIVLSRLQGTRTMPAYILIFLLVIVPGLVFAKETSTKTPENATAKSYGSGWNCNPGFRESKGGCATIKIPVNAYPTNKTYGQGWECKRGFREVNNNCNHIKVPKNGYLDYSGIKVKCDRGYLLVNKTCKAIKVPVNGYLKESSYGSGWTCERGYRANKGACVALKIPENAHIDYSGKAWECNKPYSKKQNNCILQVKN